ncbi:SDR family oxidoreductase [Psychromarinibacter halotolerans]|uniref:SDR family oxidoreductase n=1 Tax=Psychromarinibacter halotolerans TaxID=1775175 RepID=A0ABV7GX74_9RHOB|nr:SDR family oxidoreductase [Psychromarinibacter halotolerans]MDF0595166.1 SDR family oxidoreductase [Psychromarinibacter halotolerans]
MDLTGKTALITGGTHGLGGAIASGLHAAGAKVLITGIEDEMGASLAAELGEGAAYQRMDLAEDGQIDTALEVCKDRFGGLDIVVHNACSYLDNGMDTTREDWLTSLNINVVGAAMLMQKARPYLTAPGGVIVFMGSVSAKSGNHTRGPYSVSKAALMQLTKLGAVQLGTKGIRVLSVSPGWTWTPPMEDMTDGDRDLADKAGAQVKLLGRVGRMTEVSDAVVFACSDAASWITGCDIPVDGGFTALGPDRGLGPRHWCAEIGKAD